jgi:dTDP-L-rhamnose 4-epimerase
MRALLTGGAGFIGTRLTHALVNRGYEVTVLDNLDPQIHGANSGNPFAGSGVVFYQGDVTDSAVLSRLTRSRFDLVVHLAAETSTGKSLNEASKHAWVNVLGTTRLMDALSTNGTFPEHIILPSSRSVYGEGEWIDPIDLNTPIKAAMREVADLALGQWLPPGLPMEGVPMPSAAHRTSASPTNVYAATKLAQEHLFQAWCSARGVPLTILRLQNVYGPGQSLLNSYTGVLTLFARLAVADKEVRIYEDGGIVRDFVYIDDVISAFLAACEHPPAKQRILDIGSGIPSTLLEIGQLVVDAARAGNLVVSGEFRPGDVRCAFCDIHRANEDISWYPKTAIDDGIRNLIKWIRSSRANEDFGP